MTNEHGVTTQKEQRFMFVLFALGLLKKCESIRGRGEVLFLGLLIPAPPQGVGGRLSSDFRWTGNLVCLPQTLGTFSYTLPCVFLQVT